MNEVRKDGDDLVILSPRKLFPALLSLGLGFVMSAVGWSLFQDTSDMVTQVMLITVVVALFLFGAVELFGLRNRLRLTADGFSYSSMFRRKTFHWKDVQRFSLRKVHIESPPQVYWSVVWKYKPHAKPKGVMAELRRGSTGFDAELPETFGMDSKKLERIMNTWRKKHS